MSRQSVRDGTYVERMLGDWLLGLVRWRAGRPDNMVTLQEGLSSATKGTVGSRRVCALTEEKVTTIRPNDIKVNLMFAPFSYGPHAQP
jgi:hypothetical protein